jgi:hypothetical protein
VILFLHSADLFDILYMLGRVVESVDTRDLKSLARFERASSSLAAATN